MKRQACSALALCAVLAVSSRAAAQQKGFAVDHLDTSEQGSEWFAADSLDLRGHIRPAVGVLLDWAYKPLVVDDAQGNGQAVVRDQVFVRPGLSLVFFNRLRASVEATAQIYATGKTFTLGGLQYSAPKNEQEVGDVRWSLDSRLFGQYGDPATFAMGVAFYGSNGHRASYTGDGMLRAEPRAMIAGDIGMFTYAARFSVIIRGLEETYGASQVGSQVALSAAAGVRLLDRALVVGPEFYGASTFTHGAFFDEPSTPLEVLIGGHYTAAREWRFGAGIATGLNGGYGAPVARGVALIAWTPDVPPPDRDGDGVLDKDDACPDVPGIKTNDPKTNGCPPVVEAPADRDGDGILDKDDACPDIAGIKTDDPATSGCPPPSDRDKDTIFDKYDACPDEPGVLTDDPKTNGCPVPPDRDKDGVLDKDDACPDVPGIKTNDPKTNGCPDPDRDKDGIPNDNDACPDVAGKADPDPKRNGCPAAFIQGDQIKILDQVKFKTDSAEIVAGKESEDVLLAVEQVIKDHPEITRIRIEGHTDNRGTAAHNKKLSAARAGSVVKWLATHGIDAARLTSEGFGFDKPIDTNDTEVGRKNNRRVEFHIVPKVETPP